MVIDETVYMGFYIGTGFALCYLSLVMLITDKARIEMEIGVAGSLGVT